MNQDTFEKQCTELLSSMAERISYLVREGYTKGQISEYCHKKHESSSAPIELITMLNDIADRMIDTAIFAHARNRLQPEIGKLYEQMDDEKKLSYIGKDGRDYYSREALESANQDYMDQMYTENKPRTM